MALMLRPGLVSVTFRALSPREIVALCAQNGLQGIEWGADVHAPPGDLARAREVAQMTRDAGLEVAAYGSYFRCDGSDFAPVLEAALELGAPLIRVWAGASGSASIAMTEWNRALSSLYDACEMAQTEGVALAVEYHGDTLTDTRQSCRQTLQSVGHPALRTLWQPLRRARGFEPLIAENLGDLREVAPDLANVHVYEWRDDENGQRRSFSLRDSAQWPLYFEELKRIGGERWALLEFLPGDAPGVLPAEAQTLRAWCEAP